MRRMSNREEKETSDKHRLSSLPVRFIGGFLLDPHKTLWSHNCVGETDAVENCKWSSEAPASPWSF